MLASVATRYLPSDFVESSLVGGIFTVVTYVIMLLTAGCELSSFLSPLYTTVLSMDMHSGEVLQINLDVDLIDIDCRNVRVAVYATQSQERLAAQQDFWLRPINWHGKVYGMAQRPKELTEDDLRGDHIAQQPGETAVGGKDRHTMPTREEQVKLIQEDGKAELDSDWLSSHDGLKHEHFDHVVRAHNFTFVNFFASWCSHCRAFANDWALLADIYNHENLTGTNELSMYRGTWDHDEVYQPVRFIKLNCEEFPDVCKEQGIDAYPTLRLYKADGRFTVYEGVREERPLQVWLDKILLEKDKGWEADHENLEKGCNLKGRLGVKRVPGHLEFTIGQGDQLLDLKMANVTHYVRHWSFSDPDDGRYHRRAWFGMPNEITKHISPIDQHMFVTKQLHQTWIHDMQVVSTANPRGTTSYQIRHYKRLSDLGELEYPHVLFHYDIEPFSVHVTYEGKQWYDFATSTLAILGGFFVVMRLLSHTTLNIVGRVESSRSPKVSRGGSVNLRS